MNKILLSAIVGLLFTSTVTAQQPAIFSTNGKAIKGYDPVAFFTEGGAVRGYDSLSFDWQNAHWLFATRENLENFKATPEKFAPQYGGYCAYGAAQGHKAPTETDTWTIINSKLYFNYNKQVKEAWMKDQSNLIQKADSNWKVLKEKDN